MAVLVSAGGAGMGHTRHQILTECHEAFFFFRKMPLVYGQAAVF
jgi:hypothetical protein